MHPFPIDAFAYSNRLRAVHPGEKLLFTGATVAVCLLSRAPLAAVLALLMVTLAATAGAGLKPRVWWYFLRVPAGFALVGVATIAVGLVPPENASAALAVPVGPWRIGVTAASLAEAGRVLAVSLASVAGALFLALTTPVVDLTDQLRRWGVPGLAVELMTLVYRFVFVLVETAADMYVAQDARLGYSSWRRALRSAGILVSNLYLRSQAHAGAIFTALEARGYTGELRVLAVRARWSARRLVLIGAAEFVLLLAALAPRLPALAVWGGRHGPRDRHRRPAGTRRGRRDL